MEILRGPLTNDANEFAAFELAHLGYDVKAGREVSPPNETADDLLLLTLGDPIEPGIFAGLVWAVKNRSVNWKLHLDPANPQCQSDDLRRVLDAAGLYHLAA